MEILNEHITVFLDKEDIMDVIQYNSDFHGRKIWDMTLKKDGLEIVLRKEKEEGEKE